MTQADSNGGLAWRRPSRATLTYGLLLLLLAGVHLGRFRTDKPFVVGGDGGQYMRLALNLSRRHVFAQEFPAAGEPAAPTNYRSPFYPLFLAAIVTADPVLRHVPQEEFQGLNTNSRLRVIGFTQRLLYLGTAILVLLITWQLSRSRWAGLLAFGCVLLVSDLRDLSYLPFSENMITFLVASTTALSLVAARRMSWVRLILTGVSLALLALTRATFLYYFPILLLGMLLLRDRGIPWKRFAIGLAGLAAAFLVIAGAWVGRNQYQFGHFSITTGRGGTVIGIRAAMNGMRSDEYWASFFYWSNSPLLRDRLAPRWFGPDSYARLDRNNPDCFHDADRRQYPKLSTREALKRLASQPLRHLALCLPLAHRGMCLEKPYLLNWLLWLTVAGALLVAVKRRDRPWLLACLPIAFLFFFHTGLTHCIPRYNQPLSPLIWGLACAAWWRAARWVNRRRLNGAADQPVDQQGTPQSEEEGMKSLVEGQDSQIVGG